MYCLSHTVKDQQPQIAKGGKELQSDSRVKERREKERKGSTGLDSYAASPEFRHEMRMVASRADMLCVRYLSKYNSFVVKQWSGCADSGLSLFLLCFLFSFLSLYLSHSTFLSSPCHCYSLTAFFRRGCGCCPPLPRGLLCCSTRRRRLFSCAQRRWLPTGSPLLRCFIH